jgi:hypothetical protein
LGEDKILYVSVNFDKQNTGQCSCNRIFTRLITINVFMNKFYFCMIEKVRPKIIFQFFGVDSFFRGRVILTPTRAEIKTNKDLSHTICDVRESYFNFLLKKQHYSFQIISVS